MAYIWMMVLQNVMLCAFVCGRQHFLVCQLPLSSGRKSTISLILGGSSMVLVLVCQTVWLSVLGSHWVDYILLLN
jgi:hypothetical protein